MIASFPKLNPLAVMFLNSYLAKIRKAPFVSHVRNVVLPARISEVLQIDARIMDDATSLLGDAIQTIERSIADIESSEFHSRLFHKTISAILRGASEGLRDALEVEREAHYGG